MDFAQINQAAISHLPALLPELLPGGRFQGREYVCGNLNGKQGQSLSVNMDSGKWADFATGQKGGDSVSLLAAARGLSQGEAARALAERIRLNPCATTRPITKKPDTWRVIPTDTPPEFIRHPKHGTPVATWEYCNQDGALMGYACRFDLVGRKKEIIPYTHGVDTTTGETDWQWKSLPTPRPLYGLNRLAQRHDAPVLVVEGEKATDAAQRLFPAVVCITWPGGSSAVVKTDWTALKGRRVAIWPDNDESGRKAAEAVALAALEAGALKVFIVTIPEGKAEGWDLADAEAEGLTAEQATDWIKQNRQKVESDTIKGEPGERGENPRITKKTVGRIPGEPGRILGENEVAGLLKKARTLLKPAVGSAPTYPVDALGLLADACKDISTGGQVPVEMAGQCLLGTAALLVQSKANVRTLAGVKPLSLYCQTNAESGEGKTTADDAAQRAVIDWQRKASRQYLEALQDFESAKAGRKKNDTLPEAPREPYLIMRDGTVEGIRRSFRQGAPSQGVFSSEAAVMLSGYGMSPDHRAKSAANFNALWDSGEISVARGLDGRVQLYDRRLSLHWLVQPDVAYAAIHDPLLANIGFWPRFLLACPAPAPPLLARRFEPEGSAAIRNFWSRCEELLALPLGEDCSGLPVIAPTAEAEKLACRFFEAMQREAKTNGGKLVEVKPFAVRATEQAFRIAAVLAAFTGRSEIDVDAMRNGMTLSGYSLENWRLIFGDQEEDAGRRWAMLLFDWLLKQSGQQATGTSILKIGKAIRLKDRRDTGVALLQQVGLIDRVRDSFFVITTER